MDGQEASQQQAYHLLAPLSGKNQPQGAINQEQLRDADRKRQIAEKNYPGEVSTAQTARSKQSGADQIIERRVVHLLPFVCQGQALMLLEVFYVIQMKWGIETHPARKQGCVVNE